MSKKRKKEYIRLTFNSRDEWLNARALGGSSIGAIFGVSPYKTKLELYRAIVSPAKKKKKNTTKNESMLYGIKSEPLIRKQFEIDFPEYKVIPPKNNEMFKSTRLPYLTATLDGRLIERATKRKGILEIKTHDIRNREDEMAWTNDIPYYYYLQTIHYLLVMNDHDFVIVVAKLRFWDYYHDNGKKLLRTEYRYYIIERNERLEDIANVEKVVRHFWEYNVEKRIMPEVVITY